MLFYTRYAIKFRFPGYFFAKNLLLCPIHYKIPFLRHFCFTKNICFQSRKKRKLKGEPAYKNKVYKTFLEIQDGVCNVRLFFLSD